MLVNEAIAQVRSMVSGSSIDEISVLASAYDPDVDVTISLRYPKRNLGPGAVLSVGLNTFVVVEVSTDGTTIGVLPSMDGGPNVACAAGDIVYIKPMFTTYAIFRELVSEIQSMSSPNIGLYSTLLFQATEVNYTDGTYVIDPDDIADDRVVTRLLMSEFKVAGRDTWQRFAEAEWQPSGHVVRVVTDPPLASQYAFTLATTFGTPTSITTDLDAVCGVSDQLVDIPILGAAATVALSMEGRRVNPANQGDSRRATEVREGSNSSLSRMFRAKQLERINDEIARLSGTYGYRISISTGPSNFGWSAAR